MRAMSVTYWLDAQTLHAVVGAPAHAPAQERLAVRDGAGHAGVLVVTGGVGAVVQAVLFGVLLAGELAVAQFVAQFAGHD